MGDVLTGNIIIITILLSSLLLLLLTHEHITMGKMQNASLSEYNHMGIKDRKKAWVYPQAGELNPKTVEGHSTEAMVQYKEREQWFDFRVS